jgi:hypothetical protein
VDTRRPSTGRCSRTPAWSRPSRPDSEARSPRCARTGATCPSAPGFADIALAGVATHKVSRQLAKDKATSFIRAPFTRYQEPGSQGGEVEEQPRGKGVRLAIGELLVCPYCLAQWVAAGFTLGLVAAPRTTRLVASIYAAETLSDFLQAGYRAAEDRA